MEYLNKIFDWEKFSIRMNEMDYEGQKLAEKIYKIILAVALVFSIIVSYSTQKLKHGVYILVIGLALSLLLCLPSWPFYNRHHPKWVPYKKQDETDKKKKKK